MVGTIYNFTGGVSGPMWRNEPYLEMFEAIPFLPRYRVKTKVIGLVVIPLEGEHEKMVVANRVREVQTQELTEVCCSLQEAVDYLVTWRESHT